MALSSSVPSIQFTPAGLVLPTDSAILNGVLTDLNSAFGGGLNIENLETPQGQLSSSEAAIISDKNSNFAFYVNQVDPQYSQDRFQDGLGRIYFLERKQAAATVVQCTLNGLPGTPIPAGTLAQDTSNNIYACTGDVTIGAGSNVDAEFQNIVMGPIPCAAGTLIRVYQSINGWDTITNSADGTLGNNVESRQDFANRMKNSVAFNANGTVGAIYAAVFSITNVLDVYVIDNPEATTVDTGPTNYPVAAHSVYVAAVGGIDADVAYAIWSKKDVGCNYNGNTSVTVTDNSGYSYPQPSYVVTFERPAGLAIKYAVNIIDNPLLPSNIIDLVKTAIINRFNGADGTQRERIGSTIYASRYYGAVSAVSTNVAIDSILIGTSSATLTSVPVGIDEHPTLTSTDISVVLI